MDTEVSSMCEFEYSRTQRPKRRPQILRALVFAAALSFPLSPCFGQLAPFGLRLLQGDKETESPQAVPDPQPGRSELPDSPPERTEPAEGVGESEEKELPPLPKQLRIPVSGPASAADVKVGFRDGKVSLIVHDGSLKEVVTVLAQQFGLNVICSEDVTARVSITISDVPLEHVLTAITSVAGYTWARHQGIIHITSIAGAASLPPEVQGRRVEVFPLDFAPVEDVEAIVKGILSPAGKSYTMQSATADNRKTKDMIVVEDLPPFLERVREYIRQVDEPPRQVLIEGYILEVDLGDDKNHGVNFTHLMKIAAGKTVTLELAGLAAEGAPRAFFAQINGGNVQALVECLQSTTDAKTLASPKIMVVNGQEARIQVGGQLGFRVTTTTETSTMETVNFLETGVVMSVTPRISRDGRVLMKVKPEVSSGAINPDTGLPEEETAELETDVILNSGQGMVIGGLIQETDSLIQSKIHFLGDLHIVGKLFQRREIVKNRSEIIIVLLPRVLPYGPEYQAHEEVELARAQTPLLHEALERYPRPWEPSLRDAIHKPILFRLPPIRGRCFRHRHDWTDGEFGEDVTTYGFDARTPVRLPPTDDRLFARKQDRPGRDRREDRSAEPSVPLRTERPRPEIAPAQWIKR